MSSPHPKRSPGVPLPSGRTKLVAVFGWPLTYTLSPRFQSEALRRHGVDAAYLALPVETSKDFLQAAKGLMSSPNFVGANITNPHKIAAVRLANTLSPCAQAIGAVNTIYRGGGRWHGHNTDAAGFVHALAAASVGLAGARVLVLGAGGAARAAVWASAHAGARRVVVLARRRPQARETAALAGRAGLGGDLVRGSVALASVAADVVVNALPGEELGADFGTCLARGPKRRACAFDLSYSPPRTAFLREAGVRGWREISGLEMLLEQGREAFACWFGCKPDREPMAEVLRKV